MSSTFHLPHHLAQYGPHPQRNPLVVCHQCHTGCVRRESVLRDDDGVLCNQQLRKLYLIQGFPNGAQKQGAAVEHVHLDGVAVIGDPQSTAQIEIDRVWCTSTTPCVCVPFHLQCLEITQEPLSRAEQVGMLVLGCLVHSGCLSTIHKSPGSNTEKHFIMFGAAFSP